MNRYFEALFANFDEEEDVLMGEMIILIGRNDMSFDFWRESLSEEERDFAVTLARRVDDEYYHLLEDNCENELNLFVEIMLYYVTYDAELGCELPAIGMLYGEAMRRW